MRCPPSPDAGVGSAPPHHIRRAALVKSCAFLKFSDYLTLGLVITNIPLSQVLATQSTPRTRSQQSGHRLKRETSPPQSRNGEGEHRSLTTNRRCCSPANVGRSSGSIASAGMAAALRGVPTVSSPPKRGSRVNRVRRRRPRTEMVTPVGIPAQTATRRLR